MKQTNYERIALPLNDDFNVKGNKSRSSCQTRKGNSRLLAYSSLAIVCSLAIITSLLCFPALADRAGEEAIPESANNVATGAETTYTTVLNSLLSDSADLLTATKAADQADSERQAQALLYMLNKMSKQEDVLKVKHLAPQTITKVTDAVNKSKPAQKAANTKAAAVSSATTKSTTTAVTTATQAAPTTSATTAKNKSAATQVDAFLADYDSGYEDEDEFARTLTDRELMYYIVMAETGAADLDSISLVAQIIANRVKMDARGLRAVLKEPNQFSCFENGSYKRLRPSQRVIEICDAAMDGRPLGSYYLPPDVIFYCTVSYYKTQPAYFHSLKRILTHSTQVFFALASSDTQPMDNWTYETTEATTVAETSSLESTVPSSAGDAPVN